MNTVDRWEDEQILQTDGWMKTVDEWIDRWLDTADRCMDGWRLLQINGQMDTVVRWVDEQIPKTDRWKNGLVDGQILYRQIDTIFLIVSHI